MSRHQRNDANIVKGLSFVSLVNLLSGMDKMCILKDLGGEIQNLVLHIISISRALVLYLAPVGEELNKKQ